MLDVRQAEQLVFTAAETIPDLERRIEQQENFISTLSETIPVRRAWNEVDGATACAGNSRRASSSLLERRPDIRQAEAQLIAANAQIGVAKAAYFPQIALTANSGFQSSALTSLFTGPAGLWSFAGSLVQPIFAGGKNSFRCKVLRGSTTGSTADLPADHPAVFSWGFGRAGRVPQRQGVPRAAGATCVFRTRRGPAFGDALPRRRHQLLGGPDQRNQLLCG